MKRSFSLKELQSAIDEQASYASLKSVGSNSDAFSGVGEVHLPHEPSHRDAVQSMRRSKSMTSFSEETSIQMAKDGLTPADIMLPSLMKLGLMFQFPGLEDSKRVKGEEGNLANSSNSSARAQRVDEEREDALGAVAALMQLSSSPAAKSHTPANSEASKHTPAHGSLLPGNVQGGTFAHAMQGTGGGFGTSTGMLPSLKYLLDGIQGSPQHDVKGAGHGNHVMEQHHMHALVMQQQQQMMQAHRHHQQQQHGGSLGADMMQQQGGMAAGAQGEGGEGDGEAKHNKYCHFCQHVKVKRATSMLACVNQECARRFCEHCLVTHLNDAIPKPHEGSQWMCPICRKTCCCAVKTCDKQHRHCKAFRYRQRRAEQAAKRSLNATNGRAAAAAAAAALGSEALPTKNGGSPQGAVDAVVVGGVAESVVA